MENVSFEGEIKMSGEPRPAANQVRGIVDHARNKCRAHPVANLAIPRKSLARRELHLVVRV